MFGGSTKSKSKLNLGAFLPLLSKLGEYLSVGYETAITWEAAGRPTDPDLIASVVSMKMNGWNPVIRGRAVLDPDTKQAAARFLAGVAFNLARRE